MRSAEEWREAFLALEKTEQEEVVRRLSKKIERFGGELPSDHGGVAGDYARDLYERLRETKRRHDAHMDEMLTLHEDDSYTVQSQTSGDALSLWIDMERRAVSLCNGDGVSYFTPLETRRLVLLLRDMAERLESETEGPPILTDQERRDHTRDRREA